MGRPWRWPSSTRRSASSSAGPSAPSRPSSTTPNMLVNAEETTAATWDAARADDLDSAWFAAAVAASHAIRTQVFNAQNNIQLHGGIGYTWEHDAHLYLRRARTLAALMEEGGDPLLDVVEGQRSGQAHGAVSFMLPPEADAHRRQAREAVAGVARRCRPTSSAISSSSPATWYRTGPSRGPGRRRARQTGHRGGVHRRRTARHGHHRLGGATIAQAGTDDQRERWVEVARPGVVR